MIFVPKNKRGGGWRGRKTLNGYASSKPLNNQIAKFAIDLFNGRQLENEFRLNSEQFFFPLPLSLPLGLFSLGVFEAHGDIRAACPWRSTTRTRINSLTQKLLECPKKEVRRKQFDRSSHGFSYFSLLFEFYGFHFWSGLICRIETILGVVKNLNVFGKSAIARVQGSFN